VAKLLSSLGFKFVPLSVPYLVCVCEQIYLLKLTRRKRLVFRLKQ